MNKSNSGGRSMVEMLGVLAVVGILSAGGLAGYSKAMKQHRLNKQTEQISSFIATIVNNLDAIADSPGMSNVTPYLIRLGDIPADMIKDGNDSVIYDAFGNSMYVYHDTVAGRTITLRANITAMNQNNDLALLTCRNYILAAQPFSFAINVLEFLSGYGTEDAISAFLMGDRGCSATNCLAKTTYSAIDNFCVKHIGSSHEVEFKIKFSY